MENNDLFWIIFAAVTFACNIVLFILLNSAYRKLEKLQSCMKKYNSIVKHATISLLEYNKIATSDTAFAYEKKHALVVCEEMHKILKITKE